MPGTQQTHHYEIAYRGPTDSRQYEQWRDGVCRSFCRLEVDPVDERRIDCSIEFSLVDTISLATPTGSSAAFARTRDLLTDGCDDLVLICAAGGRVRVSYRDASIHLADRQMVMVEMNAPCGVEQTPAGAFTVTRIPRSLLLRVAPGVEDRLARPFDSDPARATMFRRYFALCNDVAADLDVVGRRAAAQHLVDLAGLMLGADTDVAEPQCGEARLELMKADVLGRLDDAALTIDAVAHRNGLSVRQAQRLFAASGVTFTEFVLEQRLALARRLLSETGNRHRKMSDIAFSVGFGDLSYFNRTFRRRFGATPSDLQAGTAAVQ